MNKLHINSNFVIITLALLAIASYIVVENTMGNVAQEHYKEKIAVSQATKTALEHLKNYRLKDVVFVDNINDPNETGIIGQKFSQITTGSGSLPVKLSTANPNIGALVVQLLKDADINEGDQVAVCLTGSYPALNIATLLALEELKAVPIVIPSTTSSSWGANNPDFTILDMIRVLQESGMLNFDVQYASIGGNQDVGMSLSNKGRELIIEAIERNNLKLLNKGNLLSNIEERMKIIDAKAKDNPIELFINIGGGVASTGSKDNKNRIPNGYSSDIKLKDIPDKQGVIYEMLKRDVPIIHMANIESLLIKNDLPINPVPLPKEGEGELFYAYKYNLPIVFAATIFLFIAIGIFVYIDRRNNKLGDDIISDEIQI